MRSIDGATLRRLRIHSYSPAGRRIEFEPAIAQAVPHLRDRFQRSQRMHRHLQAGTVADGGEQMRSQQRVAGVGDGLAPDRAWLGGGASQSVSVG